MKMRDSRGVLSFLCQEGSLHNNVLGSVRWQQEEEDPQAEGSICCPLLSDDIKACQGCEGTDCEFPVFNVFHPDLSLYSDLTFT